MKFKYLEEKTAVIFENKFEIFQDCDSSSRGKQNESSLSAFMCQMNLQVSQIGLITISYYQRN